jgi:tetratricopeptide (TPR) repeat protein
MKSILSRVIVISFLIVFFISNLAFAETKAEGAKWYEKGYALSEAGRYAEAVAAYGKCIELNPEYTEAYINRGVSFKSLGKYKEALNDYNKAIELNPQSAEAYNNRGDVYDDIDDYKQALSDYNKAIELNPQYAGAYNNRGTTYVKLTSFDQAIKDFSKAIELNPQYAGAYNNRGTTHGKLKNFDQAIKDFNKAIELNPQLATSYFLRGVIDGTLGNTARADEDIKTAARLGHQDAKDFLTKRGIDWKDASSKTASAARPSPAKRTEPAMPVADVKATAGLDKKEKRESIADGPKDQFRPDANAEVAALVDKWAQSWMSGDMESFRNCHAENFKAKKMNLQEWVDHKIRIRKRSKNINVRIDNLRITADPTNATAAFTQYYSSSILRDKTFKKLELKKIDGEWKILREII